MDEKRLAYRSMLRRALKPRTPEEIAAEDDRLTEEIARASPIWNSATTQLEPVLEWLKLRPQAAFFAAGACIALLLLIFSGVTAAVAAVAAWIALMRHHAQTDADRQRRITESFSKAVEQLGSDKLEVRLGGIYSLQRISNESPDDHLTVMETLAAFVRERTRRMEDKRKSSSTPFEKRVAERAYFLWENAGKPEGRSEEFQTQAVDSEKFADPPEDIAAVLIVIKRRTKQSRELESANNWRLNLMGAVLPRTDLNGTHFEGALLIGAHFEMAFLDDAHLERADLIGAYLERAHLTGTHLGEANLGGAHLKGALLVEAHLGDANLGGADLEGANLVDAHLEGATLTGAHFEGATLTGANLRKANLRGATGLIEAQLEKAFGDAKTRLPEDVPRPKRWPLEAPPENH